MDRLKLFNLTDDYINYLRKFDNRVFSNKEDERIHGRKYLGTVLYLNNIKYFVPLSSPKDSDYIIIDEKKVIRKSIVPIMRIIIKDINREDELKGTLKFSNMIPVPDIALLEYDIANEKDLNYKILIIKELSFIITNASKIINNAKVIYKQKTNKYEINYLKDTVDFKMLEQRYLEYIEIKEYNM